MRRLLPSFNLRILRGNMLGSLPDGDPDGEPDAQPDTRAFHGLPRRLDWGVHRLVPLYPLRGVRRSLRAAVLHRADAEPDAC